MVKCYYRAGKDRKGRWVSADSVVKADKFREWFKAEVAKDGDFKNVKLRWSKKTVDECNADYDARGACPGQNIKSTDVKMCDRLYLMGELVSKTDKETTVKKEDGSEATFPNAHVSPYHESHDAPEVPADVCAIQGFGEGALLKTMRRRLVEKLDFYTYVGDIVMCLNPYMFLPWHVIIKDYPNHMVRGGCGG